MTRKVLIINGSLRIGGNTDMLLSSLAQGMAKTKIQTTQYFLRDKNIGDCNGCYYCYKNNNCSVIDDMQEIYDELQMSDIIVLASPMYWYGVTGLMKTFIDRLYLYYPKRNRYMVAGKKAIIITPMYANALDHGQKAFDSEIEPITRVYKYILARLGIDILDFVFYSGLGKKGDALTKTKYLNEMYDLGTEFYKVL